MVRAVVLVMAMTTVLAARKEAWYGQVIYQLLTDRFALPDGGTQPCKDETVYCGGTYAGMAAKLGYIKELGPTAIWITPIPRQVDDPKSWHGYWAAHLLAGGDNDGLNAHFGSASDLKALVSALHNKNMLAMLDVVANHMGGSISDASTFVPFNSTSFFHDCSSCPPGCNINFGDNNQQEVELCRLSGLPDLNQSIPFVKDALTTWVASQVTYYGFDGLRVDTVPEVEMPFWRDFQDTAGVYAVGEVFNGDIDYVAPYQGGALTGLLSYPLFFTIRSVFASQNSMNQLQSTLSSYWKTFEDVDALATFVDNHDNPRFLSVRADRVAYKAALTFAIMTRGIPIIYYGTEQGLNGGTPPACREPLWPTGYATKTDLFQHVRLVISVRQNNTLYNIKEQTQRYSDDTFYAFSRGQILVALTNVGSGGAQQKRTITFGVGTTWPDGCKLTNVFWPATDHITVENGGFEIYLDNGESKIYIPDPATCVTASD